MPTHSPAQRRLMLAAAHTPGGYGGVPQAVGREFIAADEAKAKRQRVVEALAKRRESDGRNSG